MVKFFLAAIAALSLAAPLAAQAQDAPSYAQPADPSYANGGDESIHGRVINFDGGYNLAVRDDRGFIDNVQLHDGTIINPTGLTLASGMVVSILGYNAGSFFAANEIDTPYTLENDIPWYAGQPWYSYGSTYSLDFFFGNPGWWHRSFYGGDHWGGFHGRIFVAPPERGGYYPHHDGDHGGNFNGGYHGGNFNGGYHGGNFDGGYHHGGNSNDGDHGGNFNGGYHGGNFDGGYHGGNFNGGYHGGNSNGGDHGGNFNGGYHGGNSNGGDHGGNFNGGYHGGGGNRGDAGGDTRGHGSDRRAERTR
jgi:hypothetical protein